MSIFSVERSDKPFEKDFLHVWRDLTQQETDELTAMWHDWKEYDEGVRDGRVPIATWRSAPEEVRQSDLASERRRRIDNAKRLAKQFRKALFFDILCWQLAEQIPDNRHAKRTFTSWAILVGSILIVPFTFGVLSATISDRGGIEGFVEWLSVWTAGVVWTWLPFWLVNRVEERQQRAHLAERVMRAKANIANAYLKSK